MGLIIIIGAGPGISQAVAQKFGQEGYKIALIGRTEAKLDNMVVQLQDLGIEATYALGDASVASSLQQALTRIRETEGQADLILYNVSMILIKDVLEIEWADMQKNFEASVGGAFHLMKMMLPSYLKENKGKIFVTGGGTAFEGHPQWTSLSVAKAALRNLMQAYTKRIAGSELHLAHLIVGGTVDPKDEKYSPARIAEQYWRLFQQKPGEFEYEIIY